MRQAVCGGPCIRSREQMATVLIVAPALDLAELAA